MGLDKDQIATRHLTLGASEIGAVAGLNPWQSAHDVWLEKMQLVEHVDNARTRIGDRFEAVVRDMYCEDQGCEVAHFGTIVHSRFRWLSATPDSCVFGARRLLEVKIVGWRVAPHWGTAEDAIPDYYRSQVEQQMEVCDADSCDVAAVIGGTDYRIYRIQRDRSLAARLIEIGQEFWERHVLTREPPPVDGTEGARRMLGVLYPKNRRPLAKASALAEDLVRRLADLEVLETQRLEVENKLKAEIADQEGLVGDGWSVTYRADVRNRRRLHWKQKLGKVA